MLRFRDYPAVFGRDDEIPAYGVMFPDLPGCVTQGDDLEDAMRMAREVLALHLFGMYRDGDPIPEPSTPESVTIPEDWPPDSLVLMVTPDEEALRELCERYGLPHHDHEHED